MNSGQSDNLTTRPATPGDMEFLYEVYASTRQEELAPTGWSESEKEAFLRMQFQLQDVHYRKYFPEAEFSILLVDDESAGRLYLHRNETEIRIIDIALLPEYRGRGIGTVFMQQILSESESSGLPLRLHVEQFNPARGLYEQLGFRVIDDSGMHYLMEYLPESHKKEDT